MRNRPASPSAPASSRLRPRLPDDLGLDAGQIIAALLAALVWLFVCGGASLWSSPAHAQTAAPGGEAPGADAQGLQSQVQSLLQTQAQALPHAQPGQQPWRVEVQLGQLDPRLKLAPCQKVKAYVPPGARLWGATRVGLRCEQGSVRWNVYWPLTVKVWAQGMVTAASLRPGTPITPADLQVGEVDLAARPSPALLRAEDAVGRAVLRPMESGQGLRQDDLKARRWFAAGETVKLTVKGAGFSVASEGVALAPGDEGQCARIRVESGRVVCAEPVGERRAEVSL